MKLLAYIASNVFTISENISKTEVTAEKLCTFFFIKIWVQRRINTQRKQQDSCKINNKILFTCCRICL